MDFITGIAEGNLRQSPHLVPHQQNTSNNLGNIIMSRGEFPSTKPPTRFQSFFFMGMLKKGPKNQVGNQIQKMFAWKSDHLMAK